MNIQLFAMSPAYNIMPSWRTNQSNESITNEKNENKIEKNQNNNVSNANRFDRVELHNREDDKTPSVEKCQTCENRKYQDGSNDPGVSFKTPTQISPDRAAAAVRGHEMEHVFHERANALREDKEVVAQSVVYKTNICPECHRVYISGGETRTVTRTKPDNNVGIEQNQKGKFLDAVA